MPLKIEPKVRKQTMIYTSYLDLMLWTLGIHEGDEVTIANSSCPALGVPCFALRPLAMNMHLAKWWDGHVNHHLQQLHYICHTLDLQMNVSGSYLVHHQTLKLSPPSPLLICKSKDLIINPYSINAPNNNKLPFSFS